MIWGAPLFQESSTSEYLHVSSKYSWTHWKHLLSKSIQHIHPQRRHGSPCAAMFHHSNGEPHDVVEFCDNFSKSRRFDDPAIFDRCADWSILDERGSCWVELRKKSKSYDRKHSILVCSTHTYIYMYACMHACMHVQRNDYAHTHICIYKIVKIITTLTIMMIRDLF